MGDWSYLYYKIAQFFMKDKKFFIEEDKVMRFFHYLDVGTPSFAGGLTSGLVMQRLFDGLILYSGCGVELSEQSIATALRALEDEYK